MPREIFTFFLLLRILALNSTANSLHFMSTSLPNSRTTTWFVNVPFTEPPKSLIVSAEFGQQRIPNVVGPFRIGDRPKFTCTVEGGNLTDLSSSSSSFLVQRVLHCKMRQDAEIQYLCIGMNQMLAH